MVQKKVRAKLRTSPQASAFGFGLVSKEKSMQALDMLLMPLMVCHLRGRRT